MGGGGGLGFSSTYIWHSKMCGSIRMRHSPFNFIHLGSGLFAGGGRAFLPVSGFVQYFSRSPSCVQRAWLRESEACKTALAAMFWYSLPWRDTGCGRGKVGRGLLSAILQGSLGALFSPVGVVREGVDLNVGVICTDVDSFRFFARGVAVSGDRCRPRF